MSPASTTATWRTRLPATFIDTSALYALTVPDDHDHDRSKSALRSLRGQPLITHNYVVLESATLVQARRGIVALRRLTDDLLPIVTVAWVDRELHARAMNALVADSRRGVSLVDHVSFAFMRERGIEAAFELVEEAVQPFVDDLDAILRRLVSRPPGYAVSLQHHGSWLSGLRPAGLWNDTVSHTNRVPYGPQLARCSASV
jgi:predicted nucleic acid-binding protein